MIDNYNAIGLWLLGVMPRSIDRLFDAIQAAPENLQFQVSASYYEIYCEKVRDLLNPAQVPNSWSSNWIYYCFTQNSALCTAALFDYALLFWPTNWLFFHQLFFSCLQDNMKMRETKNDGFVIQDITEVSLLINEIIYYSWTVELNDWTFINLFFLCLDSYHFITLLAFLWLLPLLCISLMLFYLFSFTHVGCQVFCMSRETVVNAIQMGKANRISAPTLMNAESSRYEIWSKYFTKH